MQSWIYIFTFVVKQCLFQEVELNRWSYAERMQYQGFTGIYTQLTPSQKLISLACIYCEEIIQVIKSMSLLRLDVGYMIKYILDCLPQRIMVIIQAFFTNRMWKISNFFDIQIVYRRNFGRVKCNVKSNEIWFIGRTYNRHLILYEKVHYYSNDIYFLSKQS